MKGSSYQYLLDREASGRPIRIGLVGVGQMGAGIVAQSSHIPGLRIVAVADVDTERAGAILERSGLSATSATDDGDAAGQWIEEGKVVITREAELVPTLPLDVVVEATGVPEVGVRVGLAAARAKRNLVSMNVEADVTIGFLLGWLFERAGAVYTIGAGDEPAVAAELVDFSRTIGLEVVAAGKGKNNPLRPGATHSSVMAEARRKGMNPRMLTAFIDGTKTMCEMAALANATGLDIDVAGMHGPDADVADLTTIFRTRDEGGILAQRGIVDYVMGDLAPGVFVVVWSEDPAIVEDLDYLKVGSGPYWSLIRPFHLANLEVPISVVRAIRDARPTLVAEYPIAEVVAVAKRTLDRGEEITGIGGDEVHGLTIRQAEASERNLVPLGLLEGTVVARKIEAGSALTFEHVELDESRVLTRAWRLQQQLVNDDFPDAADLEEVWDTMML